MIKRRALDEVSKLPSIIDRDAVYVGNLEGRDNYVVHGEVTGDADLEGALMLGPGCRWQGNIRADVVVVRGRVMGDIQARVKLDLRATARVTGNVSGPLIAIADGAVVQGEIGGDSVINHYRERRTH
ncbi:MAG TPA: polymer-forming cytoskeletal protein [Acidiferrobacterales bacterium]